MLSKNTFFSNTSNGRLFWWICWYFLIIIVHSAPALDQPFSLPNIGSNYSLEQTNEFLVSIPISSQSLIGGITTYNILDQAASLLYENALWKHPSWNVSDYINLANAFSVLTRSPLSLQLIFNTISSTGSLPLVIFFLFAALFFIISTFQIVIIPCCCFCCCKARKRGYKRRYIIRTSISTLFVLGGFIYLSVMTILYSTNFSAAVDAVSNTTMNVFGVTAAFAQNLLSASKNVSLSVRQAAPNLVQAFKDLDYNTQLVLPTLKTPYQVLQTDWNLLAASLNHTKDNLNTAASTISLFQTRRSNNIQALNALSQDIQSLSTIQISGITYSTPNPPNGNAVLSSSLPDLSSLPPLTPLQNNLNSLPNLSNSFSSIEAIYVALPNTLSTNISTQLNSSLSSSNTLDVPINQTFTKINIIIEPLIRDIYNAGNSTRQIFDTTIKKYDYIRSDIMKIMYFIFISFCSIGCIGVFAQKGKCMYLVIPFVLILAIVFWIQFFIYFTANFPINEVCRAKDPLLASDIPVGSSLVISPNAILNSCANHGNLFNLTIASSNTTFLQGIGASQFSEFFDNPQALLGSIVPFSTLNASVQSSIGNPFPDLAPIFQNVEQALTLPNGFTFSVFQIPPPYSLSNLQASLTSFSNGLTPSTINPAFSTSSMNTKITDFNTYALSGNSAWVPWTYNDFVQRFITNRETFSASAYVTGSPTHPSNTQITNGFNAAFQDVQFNYNALSAISQMQSRASTVSTTAAQVLTPILDPLQSISTSMSFVQGNHTSMIALAHTTLPQDATQLQQAILTWATELPQIIYTTIQANLVSLLSSTKQTLGKATDCYEISAQAVSGINVMCSTTRAALNGLWFCAWLCGLNVFPALFFLFQALKRFGNRLQVIPVKEIKDTKNLHSDAKKKKKIKRYGKSSEEEKQALKSEPLLQDEIS